jgi:hypothetical protein
MSKPAIHATPLQQKRRKGVFYELFIKHPILTLMIAPAVLYLYAPEGFDRIYDNMRGPLYSFGSFDVRVEYPDGPVIKDNVPARVRVVVINKGKTHEMYYLRWISPGEFRILPGLESTAYIPLPLGAFSGENMMEFTLSTETVPRPVNRFALELTCQNKGTTMLIPVVLLNTTVEATPIEK